MYFVKLFLALIKQEVQLGCGPSQVPCSRIEAPCLTQVLASLRSRTLFCAIDHPVQDALCVMLLRPAPGLSRPGHWTMNSQHPSSRELLVSKTPKRKIGKRCPSLVLGNGYAYSLPGNMCRSSMHSPGRCLNVCRRTTFCYSSCGRGWYSCLPHAVLMLPSHQVSGSRLAPRIPVALLRSH